MKRLCVECGRVVRVSQADEIFVWHRLLRKGRKWCINSPGYKPADPIARAAYGAAS